MAMALITGVAHAEIPLSPSETAAADMAVAAAGQAPGIKTSSAGTIRPVSGPSVIARIQAHDLTAFAASTHPAAPAGPLAAQVLAALAPSDTPAAAMGSYAAGAAAPAVTPAAPAGSDAPAITGADPKSAASILDLNPLSRLSGIATGMSTGMALPVPDDALLAHDTASGIVRAFRAAPGTADQAASDAAVAATTGDPAMDERLGLARTVFKVDGTDELMRHFVATTMMKVIITEVAKYIDINKLSETDKYRLSAIAAAAQTELEEKVLNANARVEATYLSKADLTLLIVAYDTDAQRKQTQLRLGDTGKSDRAAALDITMAQYQIVKSYEITP